MQRLRLWFCRSSLPVLALVAIQVIFGFAVLIALGSATQEAEGRIYGISLDVARDGSLYYSQGDDSGRDKVYDLNMNLLYTTGPGEEPGRMHVASLWPYEWGLSGIWSKWERRECKVEGGTAYWLEDEGCLAFYDEETRRCAGYLGVNGYVSERSEVRPFTGLRRHRYQRMGQAEEGIFSLAPRFDAVQWRCRPQGVKVVDFDEFSPRRNTTLKNYDSGYMTEDSGPMHCAILTDTAVLLYGEDENYVTAIQPPLPAPHGWQFTSYRVGMSDSGIYYFLQRTDSGTYVRTASRAGVVLSDTMVADSEPGTYTTSNVEFDWLVWSQPGIPAISTIGLIMSGKVGEISIASDTGSASCLQEMGFNWWYVAWYIAVLAGICLLYRRHLSHQPVARWQKWLWLLAWIMFPLFAPLVYLGAMDWSRLVKCPNCGRRRPVDRDLCPHCAAAFPRPSAKGIELIVS